LCPYATRPDYLRPGGFAAVIVKQQSCEGDVMRNLTYVAIMLAAITGVAPAMAQTVQSTTPDTPMTVGSQMSAATDGQSMVSQGGYAAGLLAPGTLSGDYGQPSPTQGIPGGNQPSASHHSPE
jgi:hypothetical protein